jgi:hypothetical protein
LSEAKPGVSLAAAPGFRFRSIRATVAAVVIVAGVAAEIVALRARFRRPLDVHRFFAGNLSWNGNIYRAAVTAGLVGDIALARKLFARIKALDPSKHGPQLKDVQAECVRLLALLDDPVRYRSEIVETIAARRQKGGLPPDPQCLDSLNVKTSP